MGVSLCVAAEIQCDLKLLLLPGCYNCDMWKFFLSRSHSQHQVFKSTTMTTATTTTTHHVNMTWQVTPPKLKKSKQFIIESDCSWSSARKFMINQARITWPSLNQSLMKFCEKSLEAIRQEMPPLNQFFMKFCEKKFRSIRQARNTSWSNQIFMKFCATLDLLIIIIIIILKALPLQVRLEALRIHQHCTCLALCISFWHCGWTWNLCFFIACRVVL
jgi:hypothetical protein